MFKKYMLKYTEKKSLKYTEKFDNNILLCYSYF